VSLLTFIFNGCLTRQEVLAKKSLGQTNIYALPYDQAYTAARAALRWSSDDAIEDHSEEGYILSLGGTIRRYGKVKYSIQRYNIIWLDIVDSTKTNATIVTSDMVFEQEKSRSFAMNIRDNMDYAAQLLKDGKPLPTRR
jgi:hypothetical protein